MIALSLGVGAAVGLVAVGFSVVVALAGAAWQPDAMPTRLGEWAWRWSPAIGLALLAAAIAAGQILARLQGGRPQGPADLILAAQQDADPAIRAGAASSLLALVNLSGGASVGIFGPLVRLGGCLAAWLRSREWLRLSVLQRDVVLGAGAGAAIAAVFSAPIGAAIFAHEAIIRRFGAFGPEPVIACSFSAWCVSDMLLGDHRVFSVSAPPPLAGAALAAAFAVGLASGLASTVYMLAVTQAPRLAQASGLPLAARPLVPAALLFLLSPALPHLLGTGVGAIDLAMGGRLAIGLLLALVVAKIALTSLCLGFGFFGGVFGPALFFGAMLGGAFDLALAPQGGALSSYAVLGAASCVGAVIGAPIAATVIVFELTGSYAWAVLSMISVVTASQISRAFAGRSLFDRQLALRGIRVDDDHPPAPPAARR